MPTLPLALLLLLALVIVALQIVLLLRSRREDLLARLDVLREDNRHLREALAQEQRAGRGELQQGFEHFRAHLGDRLDGHARHQAERIEAFAKRLELLTDRTEQGLQTLAQRLAEDARRNREETTLALMRFGTQQGEHLAALAADSDKRLAEVRATLEARLQALQADNAAKLEQMRATVDEKLHATLESRLTESFGNVTRMLAQVHQGLGEMQSLAAGVGDLKRVLGNVKTRGGWGEVQLESLLEQLFAAEQYARGVMVKPGSREAVDFAIRLPGRGEREAPVWLPIDAKFPREDYERLLDAQERADAEAAKAAGAQLERAIRAEARSIREKYIAPPHTTDFAVLFLPTEGLYAEVIRRPGVVDALQREHRVVVAGPTTLAALLNSLQMGFRTLAIEQRSSEVWRVLGAVKTEFGKFGEVLDRVGEKLEQAQKQISQTGVRSRAIERKLREVETLPGAEADALLGLPDAERPAEPPA